MTSSLLKYKNHLAICFLTLALAVAIGAFGAHGLQDKISPKYLEIYKTGNFYHFTHGIGAIIAIIILDKLSSKRVKSIVNLFLIGILLFSGSLYILSCHEIFSMPQLRKLGAITPIGGLLFIIAWLWTGYEVFNASE